MTKEVLYGADAIKRVEELEGRELSLPERLVVEEEGFVNAPYKDTKGITTYGVGQTGKWINKSFGEAFKAHEKEAKKLIPSYDSLPEEAKAAVMSAAYRGDLQQSPKFRKLFNEGKFAEAAQEFLNNEDYKQSVKEGTGVAGRMERIAEAVFNLSLPQEQPEENIPVGMDNELTPIQTYQVQPGDTLYSISRKLGISVPDLVLSNNITDRNMIQPGVELEY